MFRLDLNGAFERRRAEHFYNKRRAVLQRPSRIITRLGGDRLECIEKRGGRRGVRLELLRAELLEVINIDGHVIFLALSSYILLGLNSSIFPRLSRLSVVGFCQGVFPDLSRVTARGLGHFILVGFSHLLAGLSPGNSPGRGPGVGFGLRPFVVPRLSHGIFPWSLVRRLRWPG
jgi:hypothetical protein